MMNSNKNTSYYYKFQRITELSQEFVFNAKKKTKHQQHYIASMWILLQFGSNDFQYFRQNKQTFKSIAP